MTTLQLAIYQRINPFPLYLIHILRKAITNPNSRSIIDRRLQEEIKSPNEIKWFLKRRTWRLLVCSLATTLILTFIPVFADEPVFDDITTNEVSDDLGETIKTEENIGTSLNEVLSEELKNSSDEKPTVIDDGFVNEKADD